MDSRLVLFVLCVIGTSGLQLSPLQHKPYWKPVSARSATSDPSQSLSVSPIVTTIEASKTIEVHALTQAMLARGEDVVSLCVGEPDYDPPAAILAAAHKVKALSCSSFILHQL